MKLCAQIIVLVAATAALAVSFRPIPAETTEPAPAAVSVSRANVEPFVGHVRSPAYRPAISDRN